MHVVLASGGEFTALKVLEEENASRFVVSLPACYLVVDGLVIHSPRLPLFAARWWQGPLA